MLFAFQAATLSSRKSSSCMLLPLEWSPLSPKVNPSCHKLHMCDCHHLQPPPPKQTKKSFVLIVITSNHPQHKHKRIPDERRAPR
ncbi:hypothetical protein BC829DRAFT_10036 [Chytridium lagenaria]|nr:hypothetical protein BC829DRAFT_10036 [Chytridium lagenaria]